jgi:pyruvate/2-oxoglutarate dehydrogenase complex dihydrolipoamide dehydrogenase (E3) component
VSFPAHKLVWPEDQFNLELLAQVHPREYVNPIPDGKYNLVVIGGGTAGLVTAVGAAGLGAKVALIERHLLGGDCLNVGCVPSKALIRAARAAHEVKRASEFGLKVPSYEVDFAAVMERVRELRARIAPVDGVQSLKEKKVDVYIGEGKFLDGSTIEVGDRKLSFARAVIASGARAVIPKIPGIEEIEPLTNENLFWLTELPRRLAVVGSGPIGAEMAQAFARLGSQVTIYDINSRFMHHEDPDASDVVKKSLERDGVRFRLGVQNMKLSTSDSNKVVSCDIAGKSLEDYFDHILIGVGRAPNVEGMNLDKVGVEYDREGVHVNDMLRTTNAKIFACGDVASKYKFTHAADALARIVIGNALFFSNAKASDLNIPWATYTDPEIAHVGVYETSEDAKGFSTIKFELQHQDRAILDGADEGFIKITHDKRGNIKGATIVSEHAGELIGEIVVAMNGDVNLSKIASSIHPYPTQSEMIKKCGDLYRRTLLTPSVAKLLERILKWRR